MNSYVIRQEISSQLPVPSFQLQTARELLRKGGQLYLTGRETDNVSASKTCGHEGLRSSLYLRVRKCELATLSRSGSQRVFCSDFHNLGDHSSSEPLNRCIQELYGKPRWMRFELAVRALVAPIRVHMPVDDLHSIANTSR